MPPALTGRFLDETRPGFASRRFTSLHVTSLRFNSIQSNPIQFHSAEPTPPLSSVHDQGGLHALCMYTCTRPATTCCERERELDPLGHRYTTRHKWLLWERLHTTRCDPRIPLEADTRHVRKLYYQVWEASDLLTYVLTCLLTYLLTDTRHVRKLYYQVWEASDFARGKASRDAAVVVKLPRLSYLVRIALEAMAAPTRQARGHKGSSST